MKHSISNHYTIDLKVGSNPYNIPLNTLFSMATRNNPKRRFLFVSKILGKHLPVKPYVALNYSKLLALGLYESLTGKHAEDRLELLDAVASGEDNHSDILRFTKYPLSSDTVFIGFAETATGMTHSVFEASVEVVDFIIQHANKSLITDLSLSLRNHILTPRS